MPLLSDLQTEIRDLANPKRAESSMWFFKTEKGEYGAHDLFFGLTVPMQRTLSKKYKDLPLSDCEQLLRSKYHEDRLIALFILILQYKKADESLQKSIYEIYMQNIKHINNWDLVDVSAPHIVGQYLLDKKDERKVLYRLAKSDSLWEKRISIVSTLWFISKAKEYKDTFAISDILLQDRHDLIHKAIGWCLREVGKHVGREILVEYLQAKYKSLPRTSLRYAIEHFPEELRQQYLKGKI